ncbi:MAG: chemotaxis protein CheW [Burkholderiales bacterium]|nr:chemotaxis protein CheW [Burkholderiales bacterium]
MAATFGSHHASGRSVHDVGPEGPECSRLGVQLGEKYWLIDLADAHEVVAVPELTEVPFTRHWFSGLANIRGNPVAVVDLDAFLGGTRTVGGEHARLVVVAERHRINSALLVGRVLGLQPLDRLLREPDIGAHPPWVDARYRDRSEQLWTALDMRGLLTHPDFLRCNLPV